MVISSHFILEERHMISKSIRCSSLMNLTYSLVNDHLLFLGTPNYQLIVDRIFFCILQLLLWVIHINTFLHCFHMWNCGDVPILCPKNVMHTQHIFHHMDRNSANCDDGCILAFKGMPFRNFFQKYCLIQSVFQLEVVKSCSNFIFIDQIRPLFCGIDGYNYQSNRGIVDII